MPVLLPKGKESDSDERERAGRFRQPLLVTTRMETAIDPRQSVLLGKYVLELREPLKGKVQRILGTREVEPYQVVHLLAEEA